MSPSATWRMLPTRYELSQEACTFLGAFSRQMAVGLPSADYRLGHMHLFIQLLELVVVPSALQR